MQFTIATGIAILALLVAYLTYRSQVKTQFKRLHYTSNNRSFVLPDYGDVDKVKVSVGGHQLIYPNLSLLRIENTGRAPIVPADFDGPLILDFGDQALICHGQIKWDPPGMLKISSGHIKADKGKIYVGPVLLNPRDRIEVIVITDGLPTRPSVTARVAGVEEVVFLPPLREGVTIEALHTSLVYELRKDWPAPGVLNASVSSMPIVLDPGNGICDDLKITVDKRPYRSPHDLHLMISVTQRDRDISKTDIDKPLVLEWSTTFITNLKATINDRVISPDLLRTYAKWSQKRLSVIPAPLGRNEDLTIAMTVSGPGSDISVRSMPSLMPDIHILSIGPGDFIEKNLSRIEPRLLLSNQRLHLFWRKWLPVIRKRLARARSMVRSFVK